MRHPMASVPRRKQLRHHQHHHRQQQGGHRSARNSHETGPVRPLTYQHHLNVKNRVRDLQGDLNEGKEDFVRGWLDQVPSRRDGDGHTLGGQRLGQPGHHNATTHLLHEDSVADANGRGFAVSVGTGPNFSRDGRSRHLEEVRDQLPQQLTRKRRMAASASSLILTVNSPEAPVMMHDERKISSDDRECYYERGKRPQSRPRTSSSSRIKLGSGGRRYEKRPRHKAREDKYDTLKSVKKSRPKGITDMAAQATGAADSRARNLKKKKKAMASAREVVDHFTSQSILQDRLTMNPSLKPGLYQNGRVSTSKPPTDLTFHDMRFLQQPRRATAEVASKSHMRYKRREEEELQGISAFFSQRKSACMPDQSGRKQADVNTLSGNIATGSSTSGVEPAFPYQRPTQLQFRDKFSNPSFPSNRERENSTATRISYPSHPSLGTASEPKHRTRRQYEEESLEAEEVRKALDETGVFRNTGIVFDPSPLGGKENIPPLSIRAVQKPQGSSRPRDKHLRSHTVRYRDQGTMVMDQIGSQSCDQGDIGEDHDNKHPSFSVDHRTQSSPRNERLPDASLTREAIGVDGLRSPHEETQDDVEDQCTAPSAHQLPGPPTRPDAPKSLLVNRLEAIATMPPPPRPQSSRFEGNRQEGLSSLGEDIDPNGKPLPCHTSSEDCLLIPVASWLTSQSADQFANHQYSRVSTPFTVVSTRLTPTAIHSGTPYSRVVSSTAVPLAFDGQVLASPYIPGFSCAAYTPDTTPRHHERPSMREYIAQIEEEILDRPFTQYQNNGEVESILGEHVDSMSVSSPLDSNHQYLRSASRTDLLESEQTRQGPDFAMERVQTPPLTHAQLGSDWKQPILFDEQMDEEEGSSMIQFWRPNQYAF